MEVEHLVDAIDQGWTDRDGRIAVWNVLGSFLAARNRQLPERSEFRQ